MIMELEEVVDKLKELGELPSYSSSDKSEIERLYKEVLGKEFTKTSCNDCYRDAVIEMTVYIKKNNRMKEKCNYILKNGVLLQPEFGSNKMYTNDNLTDEVAEKYLAKNPKGEIYFAHVPTDWKERVNKCGYNQSLLDSMVESLQDGVSEESVPDTLKDFQINGKKISKKVLNLHLSKAIEIVNAMNGEGEDKVE